MSIKFKMVGSTPTGGKSLCTSCKKAIHVVGQNMQQLTLCSLFAGNGWSEQGPVPFPVAECSSYGEFNRPSMYEMEEIAWIITARKKGPAGFEAPAGEDKMEVTIKPPRREED